MKYTIFLFVILFIFIYCEKNDDFSNLTPNDLSKIQKKYFDLGFQLISFTSFSSNFTYTLANIAVKYFLFSYIFYVKSVKDDYSKESNLNKFMKEFKSLLDFNEDHFKLSVICIISVEDKKFAMDFGNSYKKKFDKNGINIPLLKELIEVEIKDINDHNEFMNVLISNLQRGLEGKYVKPTKRFIILIIIIIILAIILIGIIIYCCKKHKKGTNKNKKYYINNVESLIDENKD